MGGGDNGRVSGRFRTASRRALVGFYFLSSCEKGSAAVAFFEFMPRRGATVRPQRMPAGGCSAWLVAPCSPLFQLSHALR